MESTSNNSPHYVKDLFDIEPFTYEITPYSQVLPGRLYYGHGGNIGSLAVSSIQSAGLAVFTGLYLAKEGYELKDEVPQLADCRGSEFRPMKNMMPAPDLEEKYLIRWIHQMTTSYTRRLLAQWLSLDEDKKQDPRYPDYLEFLQQSLLALDRPLCDKLKHK